ncbi:MAG: helix-turn-helix domain-containing protein [Dermatophilaceae bacterium]
MTATGDHLASYRGRATHPPVVLAGGGFAGALATARSVAGLTQEQLAERAGLSARGVGHLERGSRTRPRRDTVRRLANALGLQAGEREALERAAGFVGPASPSVARGPGRAARSRLGAPSDRDLVHELLSTPRPLLRLVAVPRGPRRTSLMRCAAEAGHGGGRTTVNLRPGASGPVAEVPLHLVRGLGSRTGPTLSRRWQVGGPQHQAMLVVVDGLDLADDHIVDLVEDLVSSGRATVVATVDPHGSPMAGSAGHRATYAWRAVSRLRTRGQVLVHRSIVSAVGE